MKRKEKKWIELSKIWILWSWQLRRSSRTVLWMAYAFRNARRMDMLNIKELEEMGKKGRIFSCSASEERFDRAYAGGKGNVQNNTCHMYAKRWSCPPGCGDLEVCRKKIEKYREGIIVQTVGKLEDPLDGETMMETEAVHKQNFYEFEKMLRERWPGMLPIGAGCCTKCKTCTYPDAPCRFPEQAFSSMEPMECW